MDALCAMEMDACSLGVSIRHGGIELSLALFKINHPGVFDGNIQVSQPDGECCGHPPSPLRDVAEVLRRDAENFGILLLAALGEKLVKKGWKLAHHDSPPARFSPKRSISTSSLQKGHGKSSMLTSRPPGQIVP
jgi:hypothetical protein